MASVQAAEVNTRVHDVGESVQSAIVLIVQAQASEGGTTVSAEVVKVPIRAHAAGVSGQSAIALIVVERALAEKTMLSAEAEEVNTSARGVTEKDLSDVQHASVDISLISPAEMKSALRPGAARNSRNRAAPSVGVVAPSVAINFMF